MEITTTKKMKIMTRKMKVATMNKKKMKTKTTK
jgi:hypothetical protein